MIDIPRDIIKVLAIEGPLTLTQIAEHTLHSDLDIVGNRLSSLEAKGVVIKDYQEGSRQTVYRLF